MADFLGVETMRYFSFLMVTAIALAIPSPSRACPFCSAVSQTFTEEIESMDVVVIGQLIEAPPVPDAATNPDAPLPKATFRVVTILKGDKWIKKDQEIKVLYFGEPDKTKSYLMMGTDPPQLMWSTPLRLSARAEKYIQALPTLAKDGSRLLFFQEHLEDEDEMLSRDAYDEFANAPYSDLIAMKEKMHVDRLIEWIKDTDVPASRRRLYFTMLGVCGTEEYAPLLKAMMQSNERKDKAGLDALIACYLILTGPSGMDLIDEQFLKNPKAEYADTYAAIMAIRFHGTETDVIEKPRLVQSLRFMLDRPELADLVIPDLARWNDWEAMPRLVQLFKDADEKSSWVRVPVINFLRACPLPEAKKQIEELSKIDPDAVKRAQTFFPFDASGEGSEEKPKAKSKETTADPATVEPDAVETTNSISPSQATIQDELVSPNEPSNPIVAQTFTERSSLQQPTVVHRLTPPPASGLEIASSPNQSPAEPEQAVSGPFPIWKPNRIQLWGVLILCGLGLLTIYRIVLGLPLIRFQS